MNNGKTKFNNTAKLMHEALFKLISKKEFTEISVSEICKTAGVNRSTFYDHYQNTTDLLQEAVNFSISEFSKKLDKIGLVPEPKENNNGDIFVTPKYLLPCLKFIKKNKLMFRVYTRNAHIFPVNNYDELLIKSVFMPICKNNGVLDDTIIRYMSKYFLAGINAIVAEWVKNDCRDDILLVVEIIILCVRPNFKIK